MQKGLSNMAEDIKINLSEAEKNYKMALEQKKGILKNYNFSTEPDSKGYYSINVADSSQKSGRKKIYAKSIEELQEKVYQFEIDKRLTFKEVFEKVCDRKLEYCKGDNLVSRQNTIAKDKSEFKRFFGGTKFEKLPVNKITEEEIDKIIMFNFKRYDLKLKAFNSEKQIIKQTLDYAYRKYYINDNPYNRMDFMVYDRLITPKDDIRARALSDEDIKRILNVLEEKHNKTPDYISAYALHIQILTGFRRAELASLKWANVDMVKGYFYVCEQLITSKDEDGHKVCETVVGYTKTHKNRIVPINEETLRILQKLKEIHDKDYPNNPYVFPSSKNKDKCISNCCVYELYKRICYKLNINLWDGHTKGTHSFRRNIATKLINKTNGNFELTAEIMGNSPEVLKDNYFTGANFEDMVLAMSGAKYA